MLALVRSGGVPPLSAASSASSGAANYSALEYTPPHILPHDTKMVPRDSNVSIHTTLQYYSINLWLAHEYNYKIR